MIQWIYYPRSDEPNDLSLRVVEAFEEAAAEIDSDRHNKGSNEVLAAVASGLERAGFLVESGKKKADRINVPVLFGLNGRVEKSFQADAYNQANGYVIEVEAGRGLVNYQFLKDLFQACMMHEVRYLAIAVRNVYTTGKMQRSSKDFAKVVAFFDTLYASNRLKLPLEGVLLIGY